MAAGRDRDRGGIYGAAISALVSQLPDGNPMLIVAARAIHALNSVTVRERLKLTQDQQKRINELDQNWQRDMRGMTRNFATDREEGTRRYRDWSRKNRDSLKDILNEDQHRIWGETIGDPYDFSPDVYFPNEVDVKIKTQRSSDK